MTRESIFRTVEAAIRESFPDRANMLLFELERRLEPGPWTLWMFDAVARPPVLLVPRISRDALVAEVRRALGRRGPDLAAVEEGLERWLARSSFVALAAALALVWNVDSREALIDWAVDALEAGHDSESLRILAGLSPHEGWEESLRVLDRALAEMRAMRPGEQEVNRAVERSVSRDLVSGAIDLDRALVRLDPQGGRQYEQNWRNVLYETYRYEPPGEDLERRVQQMAREVLLRAGDEPNSGGA